MMKPKTIYAIQHNATKRIYVGCSTNPSRRSQEHLSHLRHKKHPNAEMQKDFDLYGEDYSCYIIEKDVPYQGNSKDFRFSSCYDKERMWMCVLKSNEPETGYNLSKWERPILIENFKKLEDKS